MVFYDGVYYGDWSVFSDEELKEDGFELSVFDSSKTDPPKLERNKAKIIVYTKGGVCLDVKTNIPEDCWEYALVDYDNDPNLTDDYVPFSDMKPFL